MPPTIIEGLDATAILLGVVGALSAVTAFFLVRFINHHDRRDEAITKALGGILTRLAVHDERHLHHSERLSSLERSKK